MQEEIKDYTFPVFEKINGKFQYTRHDPGYIVTGDTDSVYIHIDPLFTGTDASTEEIVKFADALGREVNDGFAEFMTEIFNTPTERTDIIETDREVVSDKSFFAAKKNYVMHVVNLEGVPVDKMKETGVATKRSDTSKATKDFLKNVMFPMLLDQRPYEDIKQEIDAFKERYMGLPLADIGRPMQIKKLNEYESKLRIQGDMTGFPYHVKAAMYYNSLCGPNDYRIHSGEKISLLYIKHPQYNCIAIPKDADVLPDFVQKINLDVEKQWNDTAKKKIDLYLAPLGYDYKSRQKELLKSLVEF